jgi:hypothetical protein
VVVQSPEVPEVQGSSSSRSSAHSEGKMLFAAAVLVLVHTPNGDLVEVNPDQIVSLRTAAPDREDEKRLYHKSIKCLINLADGKFVAIVENCDTVRNQMEELKR